MTHIARIYTDEELNALALRVHTTARAKGWWTLSTHGHDAAELAANATCVFEDGDLEDKLVLITTETAEAFEEYRKPKVDITETYYLCPTAPFYSADAGQAVMITREKALLIVGTAEQHTIEDKTVSDDVLKGCLLTKPEGFPIEMADAYIRVLDLLVATNNMPQPIALADTGREPWRKPGKHIFKLLSYVVKAPQDLRLNLSHVLAVIELCCHDLGVDLRAAIALKADYNDTRPARHGGKRA